MLVLKVFDSSAHSVEQITKAQMSLQRACAVVCKITRVALFSNWVDRFVWCKAHMSLQRACAVGCKITLVALCRVVWCKAHMVFSPVSALTECAVCRLAQIGWDFAVQCAGNVVRPAPVNPVQSQVPRCTWSKVLAPKTIEFVQCSSPQSLRSDQMVDPVQCKVLVMCLQCGETKWFDPGAMPEKLMCATGKRVNVPQITRHALQSREVVCFSLLPMILGWKTIGF